MDFEQQKNYFTTAETNFKAHYGKKAEEDRDFFFKYLSAVSQREIFLELQKLNKNLKKEED